LKRDHGVGASGWANLEVTANIGTGIFLIALGALLTFAVQGDLGWLDLQVAGVVLMLTGAVLITLVVSHRRKRSGTVKRERIAEAGRPETVTETRIYRDDDDPCGSDLNVLSGRPAVRGDAVQARAGMPCG